MKIIYKIYFCQSPDGSPFWGLSPHQWQTDDLDAYKFLNLWAEEKISTCGNFPTPVNCSTYGQGAT